MRKSVGMVVAVLVCSFACESTLFGVAIVQDDFETPDNGWAEQLTLGPGVRLGVSQASLGGQNALKFGLTTFAGGIPPNHDFISELYTDGIGEAQDLVYSFRNGGATTTIDFDFYANAGGVTDSPANLYLYFGASAGDFWYYDVLGGVPASSGWASYSGIDVTFAAGWWSDTRAEGNFAADVLNASELGIWIVYQAWDNQTYGIDNFTLNGDFPAQIAVPEPVTSMALAMAFLSMMIPFRRKLDGLVKWKIRT